MTSKSFAEILRAFSQSSIAFKEESNTTKSYETHRNQISYDENQIRILSHDTLNTKYFYTEKNYAKNSTFKKNSAFNKPNKIHKKEACLVPPKPNRQPGPPHDFNPVQKKSFDYFSMNSEKLFIDFTLEELKQSYKKLCLRKHPDSGTGSHHLFLELRTHYENLKTCFKKTV